MPICWEYVVGIIPSYETKPHRRYTKISKSLLNLVVWNFSKWAIPVILGRVRIAEDMQVGGE